MDRDYNGSTRPRKGEWVHPLAVARPDPIQFAQGSRQSGENMEYTPMQPDRRASRRTPVSFRAVLYYNTLMLPGCEVRDLSVGGAFVVTDGQFLPDQAMVDLSLPQLSEGGGADRLTAQIVRSNDEGVGVRLLNAGPATMRSLAGMLYRLPA